jgi:two-component system sensor histidine kinase/response regulator
MIDLFKNTEFSENKVRELLVYLSNNLPQLQSIAKMHSGEILAGSKDKLIDESTITELKTILSAQNDSPEVASAYNDKYLAFPVPSLDADLFFTQINQDSSATDLALLISLAITGYLAKQDVTELEKKLSIQKKQFNRKFHVLEQKHQDMQEETQRGYRAIQEHQENYSKTLQSDIEKQT